MIAAVTATQAVTPSIAVAQKRPRPFAKALSESGGVKTPRRAKLERAYRERIEDVVRTRLNLNDEQMQKLRGVNSRLEVRRRDLAMQEHATRLALRSEVARGASADQGRVTKLMNDAQNLQQQRFALQQQERTEVSTFLSPVQQAQYFGLQAKLRQRAQELEREQDGVP
jgi:hypothetical protein